MADVFTLRPHSSVSNCFWYSTTYLDSALRVCVCIPQVCVKSQHAFGPGRDVGPPAPV